MGRNTSLSLIAAALVGTSCLTEPPQYQPPQPIDGPVGPPRGEGTGGSGGAPGTGGSAGTGGQAATSTPRPNPDGPSDRPTAGGTNGPATVICGDGLRGGGEACDDGSDNGTAVGQCNPSCTGRVQKRRLLATPQLFDGNLGGIRGADAKCAAAFGPSWKALLSDSRLRVATTNQSDPATGMGVRATGSVDWVLAPYTHYVNSLDQTVWITDEGPFLGVRDGRIVVALTNKLNPTTSSPSWGGVWPDWQSTRNNCDEWTTNAADRPSPDGSAPAGVFGEVLANRPEDTQVFPDGRAAASSRCHNRHHLICVDPSGAPPTMAPPTVCPARTAPCLDGNGVHTGCGATSWDFESGVVDWAPLDSLDSALANTLRISEQRATSGIKALHAELNVRPSRSRLFLSRRLCVQNGSMDRRGKTISLQVYVDGPPLASHYCSFGAYGRTNQTNEALIGSPRDAIAKSSQWTRLEYRIVEPHADSTHLVYLYCDFDQQINTTWTGALFVDDISIE